MRYAPCSLRDFENGLHMHGFFDILSFQRQPHLLPIGAKLLGMNQNHGKPTIGFSVRRFGHEFNAGKLLQSVTIKVFDCLSPSYLCIKTFELASSDSSQEVA
jgi:hypothetical protein